MFMKYWSEASSLKCNWFNWPWMAPINTQMAKHAMMYYFYMLLCLSKQNQNQNKKQNRKNKGRSDIHLLPLGCLNFPIKNHYVTLEKRHGTPQYTEFFFQATISIVVWNKMPWLVSSGKFPSASLISCFSENVT